MKPLPETPSLPVKKPLSSIPASLMWLVLGFFVPGFCGVAALLYHEYRVGHEQLQQNTLQTARALVQTVDAKLMEAELLAQTLAGSDSLARKDFAAFHKRAQALLRDSRLAQSVIIYDVDGQQLVNAGLPYARVLPRQANLPQVKRVFETGKPAISEVILDPLSGRPEVSIAAPVFAGTTVAYALAVGISPEAFSRILIKQNLPPDWVVSVVDAGSRIVARTHSPDRFVGKTVVPVLLQGLQNEHEGIKEITTREGIPTVTPYSSSLRSGWGVAIGIPRQGLEAELRRTLILLAVGAMALLGLSLWIAWIISGRITRSMQALRCAAISLGAGEPVVKPQSLMLEVDEVAEAMSSASRLLKEHSHALVAREAELADAQRIAKIGTWSWNARTDAIVASPEMCRIFGRQTFPPFAEQDELMFPHSSWLKLQQGRQEVIRTGKGYNLELPALRADGSHFWINSRSEALRDADGNIIGLHGMVQDITERKQSESIAKSERFIRTITDAMPGLVAYFDREGRCRFANKAYLDWYDRSAEEMDGALIGELLGESLFAVNEPYIKGVLAGEEQQFERYLTKRNGSLGHVLENYIPDTDEYGEVIGFILLVTDIKALRLAEAELKLAANVFENTVEAIMVTDADGIILSVNPAFTEITGFPAQEAVGQTPRLLRSNHHEPEFHASVWRKIRDQGQWKGEIWNRRKNGEVFLEWQTISRIIGKDKQSTRYISVFHDITEAWQKNEQNRHRAFHDALTDLPNRALLLERLERQITMSERHSRCIAVMFLDLDRFKHVNDTLGHAIGDELLIAVARKLKGLVRNTDTVARLGGDEFVIMLDNPENKDEVTRIASRIIAVINQPMEFGGNPAQVGTSIGIALFPADGSSAAELIESADRAMYAAKHAGRNTFHFFAPETAITL